MPNKSDKNLVVRAPVVVIMGHIDHGKSTLLDYIRKTNIVADEAGGITQHVGAYEAEFIDKNGNKHTITFLDTPGHEAFCNIRERGAQAADVAILIVSAEDGVKPQTIEAYKNIKESKLPYVVAITKIDKPNASVDKARTSLGENEIYVEGWGGDIPCVPISSTTGEGVDDLLEMVMLVAEMATLKTNPHSRATGIIIESELDPKKGISATLLIKNGTLKVGDIIIAGTSLTPVRYIEDFRGNKIESAHASMPVVIVGWDNIPECGDTFSTVTTKKNAEKIIAETSVKIRTEVLDHKTQVSKNIKEQKINSSNPDSGDDEIKIVTIPVILKADVIGSLEGVKKEISKIKNDKVQLKIISEGIGEINETDVKLAQSDQNIEIIGFNVMPDKKTAAIIERNSIPLNVSSFKVIYQLSDYVKEQVAKKVPKEYEEVVTGGAKILAVFSKEKDRQVVGGKVETGSLETGGDIRIMRRDAEIGRGKLRELQQQKKRVNDVREGYEFGTLLEAKIEIATGDRIECVKTVEKK